MIALLLAWAAAEPVAHQGQGWLGVMTQQRVSDGFSLWNDAHLVPGGFFVLRTGLTAHLPHRFAATAGYAFLGLQLGDRGLMRPEHRPWAQIAHAHAVDRWRLTSRVRFDARYRRNVVGDELAPGYTPVFRVRLMFTARRDLPSLSVRGLTPYVSIGDELLLNFGREVERNRVDQNRVTASAGLSRGGHAWQVGYMNRAVVRPTGAVVMNHTALVWVFANFDLRRHGNRPGPTGT